MKKLTLCAVKAASLCFLAGWLSAAAAAPITINIPVNLSNLHPDVKNFSIFCRIKNAAGRSLTAAGTPIISLPSGSYSGTVKVEGGMDPSVVADAHSYKCFLQFGIEGAPAVHKPAPVPGESDRGTPYTEERLEHDTGAPFRHYIEGTF